MPFDYSFYVDEILQLGDGGGYGCSSELVMFVAAGANFTIGNNPPFTLNHLLLACPAFFGAPVGITGTTDGSTGVITDLSSTAGLVPGQLITGPGIPNGSLIVSVNSGGNTITISQNTTAAGTGVALQVYTTPLVPIVILQIYINRANASLLQGMYQDMWYHVMGLYIGHLATLWLMRQPAQSTAGQVVSAALATGIKVSKAVGDVSASYEAIPIDGWGAFNLTSYGQEFITYAKPTGSGGMLVW